jgi:mono/diheme cytochrome c family protein
MPATSRVGLLLLLAACGGRGDRANPTDTTAMASPTPSSQPTAMAADSARDSSTTPAAAPTPAPSARQDTATRKATAKPAAQDTAKAASKPAANPAATPAKPSAGGTSAGPTPKQIAQGDSIFHGLVAGGTCTACHGQDAKGTAVAPDLTDQQWLNGDGSYAFIVKTVTTGVPQPKQHPAPMPPKGGAQLTDDQVKAVAAYVYSLGHKT